MSARSLGIAAAALLAALVPMGLRAGPPLRQQPAELSPLAIPGADEAGKILSRLRTAGFAGAGACYLEFELRLMPRRGDGKTVYGRLWAGRGSAPAVRMSLTEPGGAEWELLVVSGAHPEAWKRDPSGAVARIDPMEPLFEGATVAAFDLQMPYLSWPGARIAGISRALGRPAYVFEFDPPAGFARAHAQVGLARAYIDAQAEAPLRTELIAPDGTLLRVLSLEDLKRVGEIWIVREADIRDERSRNKTRFEVTGAAVGLDLEASFFSPEALGRSASPPQGVVRF